MCLNDAHIYCRLEQIQEECLGVLKLCGELYSTFKLRHYRFRLSLRDKEHCSKKYKGSPAMWDQAEAMLKEALDRSGVSYDLGEGEAAFYGPKIDIQFTNILGREETLSTVQLDFLSPQNFDLSYVDSTGKKEPVVVIHRSPLSTHERFISYLIEYYGGAFPLWMAPLQMVLLPVHPSSLEDCQALEEKLREKGIRVELDASKESLAKKVRLHQTRKVPLLGILGPKECEEGRISLRRYGEKEVKSMGQEECIQELLEEIRVRICHREPVEPLSSSCLEVDPWRS